MNRHAFVVSSVASVLAVPAFANAETLETKIASIAANCSGTLGLYARKLGSRDTIEYNADVVFPAASTIKMCILLCLFQYAAHHPDVFDERRRLERDDFIGGSEILDAYSPGDTISIGKLAHAMIEQSDNTASNVLISYLGFERIKASIASAGLDHTQLRRHFLDTAAILRHSENLTTPRDMGKLLYALERAAHEGVRTVVSSVSARAMIDIMLKQEDRDKLYRGLPKGTPLANKTGEIDAVRNDVGIVDPFGEAPYVIAVYTKNLSDFSLGNSAIRKISAAIYNVLA